MDGFYVTTPIYYLNGSPHIGHAYTTVAADVATRWNRIAGRPTWFLTGTDEHGQKVMQAAQARGLSPKAHCDELAATFRAMMDELGVVFDRFIRTTDPDHEAVVSASLQLLRDHDLLYKATYEGWYHLSDEVFVTDKEVEEGKYEKDKLVRLKEDNWWFRMGRYQQALLDHIAANPDFIRPAGRRNEVLGFLRKPLNDLCISRPRARMSWGIPLPFDADFVTYVWFDALLNYLTGIGWHPTSPKPGWDRWWPPTFQLLGKDILTTHAVYWTTMLLGLQEVCAPAARPPLPRTLFAHGWWTMHGEKMSKSKGNTADVGGLVTAFGRDATRYFLMREIAFGSDGTFSYEGFLTRYNADLANDLGNLAHRGLSMTSTWLGGVVPERGAWGRAEDALAERGKASAAAFREQMDRMAPQAALEAVNDIVRAANKYIDTEAPWALNKAGNVGRLQAVQRATLEVAALAAALLLAVMPDKSAELGAKLGLDPAALARIAMGSGALDALVPGTPVHLGDPLFPRHREMPASLVPAALPEPEPPPMSELTDLIQYDDFAKVKLRTGKVLSAARHPDADKLLVLQVDIGEPAPRQIVAGIANKFAPEQLVGRTVVVVTNLAPRKLRGLESQGMLLAAGGDKGVIELATVPECPAGEVVR
jgi:methionyl-tRNA synthetase